MTDHLGNVLATVLDRKTGTGTLTSDPTKYDHWSADLASTADYYPGGMMMPGRNTEYSWSRMGMQGQQKDDEVYGKGNFVDMGDRHLDTRIIRTPKTDNLAANYPSVSPYVYALNTFPNATDPDGQRVIFVNGYFNSITNLVNLSPPSGGKEYWDYFSPSFISDVRSFLKVDKKETNVFIDASSSYGGDQSGSDRYGMGIQYAKDHFEELTSGMADGEGIQFVSHSEGGAFSAGMADYMSGRLGLAGSPNNYIKSLLYLSPDEADEFSSPSNITANQIHYKDDPVSPAIPLKGVTNSVILKGKGVQYSHGGTVDKSALKKFNDMMSEAKKSGTINNTYSNSDGTLTTDGSYSTPKDTKKANP
ncbi:MAG: hypothetical protein QM530_08895 [Phycisphaerales bacterium]|nr:hypothetical protein [Phycisphaerales bacterium]